MTKSDAGRLGGLATFDKHGSEEMRDIARKGGSYRLSTISELRLINNQKGGRNTTFKTESGELIRSKHLIKTERAIV